MSSLSKAQRMGKTTTTQPRLHDLLKQIMAKSDPERIVELYYYCQEPDLLRIIRAISAMPEASRDALASFFALVTDPQSVSATWESSGRLSLESPHLLEAIEVVGYYMQDPSGLCGRSEPN